MSREAKTPTSLVMVGFGEQGAFGLAQVIREDGQFGVMEVPQPLSSINGRAVLLSAEHEMILVKARNGDAKELRALEEIRDKGRKRAIIVAMTDGRASLDEAQRLAMAGADHVLPDTLGFDDVLAQIKTRIQVDTQQAVPGGSTGGHVICVARARGGIGATTVAVNLAEHLLERKGRKRVPQKRVAVMDLDLQFGAVASFLDVTPRDSLYRMASDQIVPDEVFVEQSLSEARCGVSVLSAPTRFAPLDAIRAEQIQALLDGLVRSHDYVIVDLPRALVDWIAPVLNTASRMLMVTDSSVPSIQQARRLIDFYSEDTPGLNVEIVVNQEKKPLIKARHHVEAANVLERPLNTWLPPDPRVLREAMDRGVPLSDVSGRAPLTKALRGLSQKLADDLQRPSALNKTKA